MHELQSLQGHCRLVRWQAKRTNLTESPKCIVIIPQLGIVPLPHAGLVREMQSRLRMCAWAPVHKCNSCASIWCGKVLSSTGGHVARPRHQGWWKGPIFDTTTPAPKPEGVRQPGKNAVKSQWYSGELGHKRALLGNVFAERFPNMTMSCSTQQAAQLQLSTARRDNTGPMLASTTLRAQSETCHADHVHVLRRQA